jgi:hypothetical protein
MMPTPKLAEVLTLALAVALTAGIVKGALSVS